MDDHQENRPVSLPRLFTRLVMIATVTVVASVCTAAAMVAGLITGNPARARRLGYRRLVRTL